MREVAGGCALLRWTVLSPEENSRKFISSDKLSSAGLAPSAKFVNSGQMGSIELALPENLSAPAKHFLIGGSQKELPKHKNSLETLNS